MPKDDKETYTSIESLKRTEPLICFISDVLNRILRVANLEYNGEIVKVNGFSLKGDAGWSTDNLIRARTYDESPQHAAPPQKVCNANCLFCYEKGTPEMLDRTDLPGGNKKFLESLINPEFINNLKKERMKDKEKVFTVFTNGLRLREEVIDQLARLKPVVVKMGFYSANPVTRRNLMKDKQPQVAIESFELLKKYKIRFNVSLVPWPGLSSKDITDTLIFLDKFDPAYVWLHLFSYTDKFLKQHGAMLPDNFDYRSHWSKTKELVGKARSLVRYPLFLVPYMYEEKDVEAKAIGIIRNSPAEHAGLLAGDKIITFDNVPISTRFQLISLIKQRARHSLSNSCKLTVSRGKKLFKVALHDYTDIQKDYYPYKPAGYGFLEDNNLGLCMPDSLDYSYFYEIQRMIERNNARSTLLLTSKIAKPVVMRMLKKLGVGFINGRRLYVVAAQNRLMGGNISIGDLMTAQDYVSSIKEFIKRKREKPDLIIIPSSSFSSWGVDLTGTSRYEIERDIDIRIEFLRCHRINR